MTVNIKTGLSKLLLVLGLLLVANSAYIAAFGDPTLFYVVNGLLHPALGIVATALFVILLAKNRSFARLAGGWALVLLGLAAVCGIYLAIVGMTRPHSLALYAHVSAAVAGLVLLLIYLCPKVETASSRLGVEERSPNPETRTPSLGIAWRWSAGVMVASVIFYGAVTLYHHVYRNPRYIIRNPQTVPLSMDDEGGGARSFMFPSSAQTPDGKPIFSEFFMSSESCRR